ncbi:MAG: hypothetical protein IPG99_07545 [Ignavibacteria bacterium]|nr:hypothetical protein [Ignavibacteria bacterium]
MNSKSSSGGHLLSGFQKERGIRKYILSEELGDIINILIESTSHAGTAKPKTSDS